MGRMIANWCQRNGCVSEEEYPIVLYGLQIMFNTSQKIMGILLISMVLGILWEVLLSMVIFCSMRYWAGGWHSSTHIGCFSTMLFICVCPAFLKSIEGNWAILVWVCMVLYSLYNILRYAPRNSKVNPITDEWILKRKRIGAIVECIMLVIAICACQSTELRWLMIVPLFAETVTLSPVIEK